MDDFHRQSWSDQTSETWNDRHGSSLDEITHDSRRDDVSRHEWTNPATGLPMIGDVDVAGNAYGSSRYGIEDALGDHFDRASQHPRISPGVFWTLFGALFALILGGSYVASVTH